MAIVTVDDELLTLLRAVPNLNVYDGYVEADETAKVISVPLPYVAYFASTGYDNDERFCGNAGGRVVEFSLTGVGSTREQAMWALNKARTALSRKRIDGRLIRHDGSNVSVRRDDDYTRPGGGPLFYGIDGYTVAV